MLTYEDCLKMFHGRNAHRSTRKLGNNTYLRCSNPGEFAVRLHNTDILLIRANGAYVYNTGGWKTVTTKQRMNEYGPVNIWSERGTWYFSDGPCTNGQDYEYADGMTINRGDCINGTVTGAEPRDLDKEKERARIKRQVKKYAKDYVDKFLAQQLPKPDAGDCLICQMVQVGTGEPLQDADHILSHMEEKYYVPSLLLRAVKRFPVAPITSSVVHGIWYEQSEQQKQKMGLMNKIDYNKGYMSVVRDQLRKAIYRWCLSQLGFSA